MNEFNQVYVGLDVHKATIAVAVARPGRGEPEYHGTIVNSDAAVRKLLKQLSRPGESLSFCYEAGPCGYGLYRDLTALGHGCAVVAPSLIPRKAGERLKT
ncbi:IS110 family transposase, partial [Pseudomonas sp. AL-54]|nr:IS110 family transposase [Pseudomonas lopnurensis]MBE7376202.1 IS110 family transposase [Pseudomonas lopnurensis]MBE7376224.1 IS110 family transposase [Pseudomonas lopnurensis]MBE7376407.1 IS110 family transposase [Pseudomonas lopnurensis]